MIIKRTKITEQSVYEIIKRLEETSSTNGKLSILKENADNEVLKECFRLAYSPTINFYQKQLPEAQVTSEAIGTLGFGLESILNLSNRVYTGNDAKSYLQQLLFTTKKNDREILERVVLRDMRCGVGATLINKVWKNLIVKPPRQGAKGCCEENLSKLKNKRKAIEQKADGSFMSFFGGFMSRSGQSAEIEPLEIHLNCGAFEGYAFEGEIVFNEEEASREDNGIVNKFVKGTASNAEKDAAKYLVWDCISGTEYKPKGIDVTPNWKRREVLQDMMSMYNTWCVDQNIEPKIKLIPRDELVSMEEAQDIFENYVRDGFEGAILKDMDAPWKAIDKPPHCVKMKRQDPADLLVTGIYEGTGKAKGKLGGVCLESSDGEIKTKCGSGFSDEQREYYWENPNDIIGKVVEIEYEKVSMDSKTLQKSVTFPIFQKVREDKLFADSYEDVKEKVRIK